MHRRNCLKGLVLCVTLISGTQPVLAGQPVLQQTVLYGPLYNITADGEIDLNSLSETGYGLATFRERGGMLHLKYSWSGYATNASGKAFKSKHPADFGDLFEPVGAGVAIDRYEYTVSRSGKATLHYAAHGLLP